MSTAIFTAARRRALADAALQEVQAPVLERELDVHHLAVVVFERVGRSRRTARTARELALQLSRCRRGADAGDDVFALRVDQVLAADLASRRCDGVAREGDAGAGVVAHVAEDHRLHVDGGAEVVRDLLDLAVAERAVVVPASRRRRGWPARAAASARRGSRLPVSVFTCALNRSTTFFRASGVELPSPRSRPRLLRLVEDAVEMRDARGPARCRRTS